MERIELAGTVGEALLRSIVSISTDAIISIDEEQKIWLFNAGAEETFGYQAEEVLGRPLSMLIPARFSSGHDRHLQSFAASGAKARTMRERMEVYGVRSNGEEFPAEAAISKTWLGGHRYFTVVLRDITSRKQAEDTLRRSEERFRQLAENVREVFWIREAGRGAIDYVSPAYDEVFGRSRERLYVDPGSFLDLVHPADVASVLSTWENVTSDVPPVTFRIRREDGQTRWLEGSAFPVRDPGGRVLRYVGVAADITDRHRRERLRGFLAEAGLALAASLEYHETLAEIARLSVEHLCDWCVIYVRVEKGVHVEVASSRADGHELAEKARGYMLGSGVPGVLERVMESGRPTLITSKDANPGTEGAGEAFHTVMEVLGAESAMVVPITARDQTLGAIALISSEMGPAYAEENLELATDVAHRAGLAIDNARLFTAAQEAIKARDEILGTVAHDLGNPLSVISIVCRSLLNKGPEAFDTATRELIEGTYESSARMARLIDDLLDVSRIDAVGLQLQREPLDPGSFLHDVAKRVRPLAETKRVNLDVAIDGELPHINADGDRLSQVMWNLLGNAMKFTPEGGAVRITGSSDADSVRVSVIDSGPGIPQDIRHTLFERFARGSGKRRGVGLGLAISKGIIEAHGGRIWADSRVGEGCAIHFTLPVSARG